MLRGETAPASHFPVRKDSAHRSSFALGCRHTPNPSIGQASGDTPPALSRLPIKLGLRGLHANAGQRILAKLEDSSQ